MENKISVVMTLKKDRFLDSVLESFLKNTDYKKIDEFVIVQDDKDDMEMIEVMKKYPFNFLYIRIDQSLSKIPVYRNPCIAINIAVKNSSNDIILKADPHVIHLNDCVGLGLKYYNPNVMLFGQLLKMNKHFTDKFLSGYYSVNSYDDIIEDKNKIVQKVRISEEVGGDFYYYAMFSKQKFMDIGGIDEYYAGGLRIEDSDFSQRMRMSGVETKITDEIINLHLHHDRFFDQEIYDKYYSYFKELKNRSYIVNQDHEWGDESIVLEKIRL